MDMWVVMDVGSMFLWYLLFCLVNYFSDGVEMMWMFMFFVVRVLWVFIVSCILEFVVMMMMLGVLFGVLVSMYVFLVVLFVDVKVLLEVVFLLCLNIGMFWWVSVMLVGFLW